ncbi:MAG TPA: ATP-binding protein [Sphingomicrobium sp.]
MTDSKPADGAAAPLEINPFFGGFVLETLTIGLYGEARSAIREYLQNGLDAVMQAVDAGIMAFGDAKIDVTLAGDGLVIRDNGIGLGVDLAVPRLTSVGASSKDYRSQAGFRGIGRLAGIAFCDKLVFVTKAQGETGGTRIEFDAKQLRKDMAPASGGHLSLADLISKNVTATRLTSLAAEEHFFEVRLEGLVNAPGESTDLDQMVDFVSQVAPVAYADDFPFKPQIEQAASDRKFATTGKRTRQSAGLEEVRIVVHDWDRSVEVRKPYHKSYAVGRDAVHLDDIKIVDGENKRWWGWVGLKREPGAFKDDLTRAIRIRVRNIQIDGTQIMGEMFSNVPDAKSYGRFNDWYVGEIFVDPTFVIPNSRRDSFEEDDNWETLQKEIIALCDDLGKRAYEISKNAQHSVQRLAKDTKGIEDRAKTLTAASAQVHTDNLLELSNEVTKVQRRVSRAFKHADLEIASQLRSLENKLLDAKTKAVRKLGVTHAIDVAQVREQAQLEVLRELMQAFRNQLDPATFSKVAQVIASVAGTTDF